MSTTSPAETNCKYRENKRFNGAPAWIGLQLKAQGGVGTSRILFVRGRKSHQTKFQEERTSFKLVLEEKLRYAKQRQKKGKNKSSQAPRQ